MARARWRRGSLDSKMSLPRPGIGDSIMILRREWLDRILQGDKTMELRHQNRKPGMKFLGCGKFIHGVCSTMPGERITSMERFQELLPRHGLASRSLPYVNTWALPLEKVQRVEPPIPYVHHQGAQGWVAFEPREETLEATVTS